MTQTLFEKYGRTPAVAAIVRSFYKRVMTNPTLRPYFSEVPLERLIEHQIAFISVAMGEDPSAYTGKSMADAHRNMHVSAEAFDLVMAVLEQTLQESQIEAPDIAIILSGMRTMKTQIVSA